MDPPPKQQTLESQPSEQKTQKKQVQGVQQRKEKEQSKNEEKKFLQGIFDPQRKKQMVSNWVNAKKQEDHRKLKYYNQLLKKHDFWDKQPTLRDDMKQIQHGSIQGLRKVEEVRKQRYDLPDPNLVWCDIDIKDEKQLQQLYNLLTNHYVQDDDNTFRFDYSKQFLKWALTPPGFLTKWHIGIRDSNVNNQLVCSITGVPVHVAVEEDKIKMCEINYLCVHKNYRSKNLASILIAEVTRQVNLRNKWQAIYTSGVVLPTPFTQATYYHRSLNPKKLIEIGFSGLGKNQTIPMIKKLYNVPQEPTHAFRPVGKKDIASLTKLINQSMQKYVVKFIYSEEQVKHYFTPKQGVVYSYVLQQVDPATKKGKITDFISFYMLPSHVMKNKKHNYLKACYSFLNFATTMPYEKLILNALVFAKKLQCDVYNCLNILENPTCFQQLHFQKGDGHLSYYLYNWVMKRKHIEPKQLAVVLF